MSNRNRTVAATAAVVALLLLATRFNTNPPTNVAQTSPEHPDPRLRTRRYRTNQDAVMDAIWRVGAAQRTYLRPWIVEGGSPMPTQVPPPWQPGPRITHIEVPVTIFTDDLTVTYEEVGFETIVDVRSASRVGRGDFGENRRHIIQFLTALDEALKAR